MPMPREETNQLLNAALRAAEFMLQKGFDPFTLVMNPDGAIRIVNAIPGTPDEPGTIAERVAFTRHVLRQMAEKQEAKATAVIGMGQVPLKDNEGSTDVVILELEHEADDAFTFYVPYERADGKATLGKPIQQRRTPTVFVRPTPTEPPAAPTSE
jgi:hypothetical protein